MFLSLIWLFYFRGSLKSDSTLGSFLFTDRLVNSGLEPSYKMLYFCLFGSDRAITLGERPYVRGVCGYGFEVSTSLIFDNKLIFFSIFLMPFSNSWIY